MPAYILKSLISLRDEITERLMQNSEFRALQSLQRSIDEVSELARREEDAAATTRPAAAPMHPKLTPASLVRDHLHAEQTDTGVAGPIVSRVTPAHFAAAKRVI